MTREPLHKRIERLRVEERTVDKVREILVEDGPLMVPTIVAPLTDEFYVWRSRPHTSKETFTKESELSYHRDRSKVKLGRANLAGTPMFYGGMRSVEMHPRITVVAETSVRPPYPRCRTFTLTAWWVKKRLDELPTLVLSAEHAHKMLAAGQVFDRNMDMLNALSYEERERSSEFLYYMGHQFTRVDSAGYWISAAYTAMLTEAGIPGIAFPSVATEYKGWCVALTPNAVDEHLELKGGCVVQHHTEDNSSQEGIYKVFNGKGEDLKWEPYIDDTGQTPPWFEHE